MTQLGSARDYLAAKQLAIAGARGRFSAAAKVELNNRLAAGDTFTDYPKTDIVVTHSPKQPKAITTIKAVKPNEVSYETPQTIWDDNVKFVGLHTGKETAFQEVCQCKKSLRWCHCPFPVALVKSTRDIIVRKSKTTGKDILADPLVLPFNVV